MGGLFYQLGDEDGYLPAGLRSRRGGISAAPSELGRSLPLEDDLHAVLDLARWIRAGEPVKVSIRQNVVRHNQVYAVEGIEELNAELHAESFSELGVLE